MLLKNSLEKITSRLWCICLLYTSKTLVTTILFNNEYQRLTFRTPIKEVRPLTGHEYFPRGRTALLDAIGQTIHQIALKQKEDEVDRRPTKTAVSYTHLPSQKFIFVSKDTDIFKLKEMFLPEVGSEKRVELAFVTNQGLKKEKILGLITIYDVMAQLPVFWYFWLV